MDKKKKSYTDYFDWTGEYKYGKHNNNLGKEPPEGGYSIPTTIDLSRIFVHEPSTQWREKPRKDRMKGK